MSNIEITAKLQTLYGTVDNTTQTDVTLIVDEIIEWSLWMSSRTESRITPQAT